MFRTASFTCPRFATAISALALVAFAPLLEVSAVAASGVVPTQQLTGATTGPLVRDLVGAMPNGVEPGPGNRRPDLAPYSRDLLGVSAVSDSQAWAVGTFGYAGFPAWRAASGLRPLVVHEVDGAWAAVDSPAMTQASALFGVGAVGSKQVWAVGADGRDALIERYDGSTWTQVAGAATSKVATLYAVSGVDRRHVWAVGTDGTDPLIEEWDGVRWTGVVPAATDCPGPVSLQSVAAVTSTDVWAVGTCRYPRHAILDTQIIEHWDGTSWTENLRSKTTLGLYSVSASGPDDVWAVGDTAQSIAEHFDGSTWTTVSLPESDLRPVDAVVAVTPSDVTVVGGDLAGPYVAHWDGTAWTREDLAGTGRLSEGELEAVAGIPGGGTVAVGHDYHGAAEPTDFTLTLAVASPDSASDWTRAPTPNPGAADAGALNAVDADNPDDAWAVGTNVYRGRTLVEHWNGTRWAASAPASPTDRDTVLSFDGVAALAPDDVWAVGAVTQIGPQGSATLAEHWDGTRWQRFPTPQFGGEPATDAITAVDALSPEDVWAVGDDDYDGIVFVLHFDGTSWTTSYQSADDVGDATGVVAIGSRDVWVVGGGSTTHGGPIALHWDGASWTSQVAGLPAGYFERLAGAAAAGTSVFAGGNAFDEEASWTGTTWQPMADPAPPAGLESGISADSARDAWAVGSTSLFDHGRVVTMHWDGSSWSRIPIAAPEGPSFLRAVQAQSPSASWTVGGHVASTGLNLPLVEQWDGSAWAVLLH